MKDEKTVYEDSASMVVESRPGSCATPEWLQIVMKPARSMSGQLEIVNLRPDEVARIALYCRRFMECRERVAPVEAVSRSEIASTILRALESGRSVEFTKDGSVLIGAKP